MREYYVVQFFLEGMRMTSSLLPLADAEKLDDSLKARGVSSTVIYVVTM